MGKAPTLSRRGEEMNFFGVDGSTRSAAAVSSLGPPAGAAPAATINPAGGGASAPATMPDATARMSGVLMRLLRPGGGGNWARRVAADFLEAYLGGLADNKKVATNSSASFRGLAVGGSFSYLYGQKTRIDDFPVLNSW